MKICFLLIKLFIVFSILKLTTIKLETLDTSVFYQLVEKKPKKLMRLFSAKKINNIEAYFKRVSIPFNILSVGIIFGTGIIVFLVIFFITNMFFELDSIRYIISIPFLYTGFFMVNILAEREQRKLESGLSDFFIQLKSALKINSDIIEAMRRIQNTVLEPFSTYVKQMLNEINAGKLPEIALDNFSNKINIEKFSFYINNVRYCHIFGGDVYLLTEKTQELIKQAINQKKKRDKETRSACFVLYILIVIDLYMYFMFIDSNKYYLSLINGTTIGQIIVNINFICIWIMIWLSRIIKKLDY